jgi:hypothetical protein
VTDDGLLKELLTSPLDDLPPPRVPRWGVVGGVLAIVGLVAVGLLLRAGGDAPPDASVTAGLTEPGGVETPETNDESSDDGASAASVVFPEPSVLHELVALGEGRIMMVGGFIPVDNGTLPLEGTWFFDTTEGTWALSRPDPAPSPRVGHALALHPPTGRVVLFGGGGTTPRPCPRTRFCSGQEDNEVWHFDPATGIWEDMTPAAPDEASWPAPRFGARFVYEPVTERLVMFGGIGVFGERFTPTFYADTWAYDPVTNEWEDLTVADVLAPVGRSLHGMVWSDDAERIIVFGGDSIAGTDDDHLWALDPATWEWEDRGVSETGPRDRWFHAVVTDPQSGRMVVIGGFGSVFTAIQGGFTRSVGPLDQVWGWSEAGGWMAANLMEEPLSPVSAAGDPLTLAIIVYDGHDVLAYDAAVDVWSVVAARPEGA